MSLTVLLTVAVHSTSGGRVDPGGRVSVTSRVVVSYPTAPTTGVPVGQANVKELAVRVVASIALLKPAVTFLMLTATRAVSNRGLTLITVGPKSGTLPVPKTGSRPPPHPARVHAASTADQK